MIITKEWLESGMKGGIGIKRDQCKVLGLPYPPTKGWKRKVIGMNITKDQAEAFLGLKDKRHLSGTQKVKLFDKDSCASLEELQFSARSPSPNVRRCQRFTRRFINHFLVPDSDYCSAKTLKMKMIKISRESSMCDKKILFAEIKKMPYKDFLRTLYWKVIAENQKRYSGKRCALCGSERFLNVHHTTYKNHGNEVFHLDDLVTVCNECHRAIHGFDIENSAIRKEELSQYLSQIKQQQERLPKTSTAWPVRNLTFDDMRLCPIQP